MESKDPGGSMAAVNLPPNDTATYDKNDQVASWTPAAGQYAVDAAGNLTADPSSGISLDWSARNQVSSMLGAGSLSESYDAEGRRESSTQSTYYNTLTLTYSHDGSSVTGWVESSTGNMWAFLNAGGVTLAGSYTANGTTTTWVPLIDGNGSTLGLVNAASPSSPATTYTYDPSGFATHAGAASSYPFLYQGMEQEFLDPSQYYYTGDGGFYSAEMSRAVSIIGAQGTSGPGDPIQYSPAGRQLPPMFSPAHRPSYGQWLEVKDLQSSWANLFSVQFGDSDTTVDVPVGAIFEGIEDLVSFFQFLFGSGPSIPPNYYTFKARLERGRRHPLYNDIDGMPDDIVLTESPASPVPTASTPPGNQAPLQRPDGRQARSLNPSIQQQRAYLALRCYGEIAHNASALGLGLGACATAGEFPAGPISVGTCSAVVAGVLGPPTALLEYATIRACVRQYEDLGHANE